MIHFSEFVSLGHPDKIADYISQYLLDRYIENDPQVKYAVEVQLKDNYVTLGGEVTSTCTFTNEEITQFVRNAVEEIGYNDEYSQIWGAENTICGSSLNVSVHIGQQSDNIAQGLNNDGWGDQGIFYAMATYNKEDCYMPRDYAIARRLNKILFDSKIGGLDIKTQVTMNGDEIRRVICAIPLLDNSRTKDVEELVRKSVPGNYKLIINGTGAYVKHSSIADCGTTGRKLAVDFYGGNCCIGGGSPWTKDGSKADLALNLFARRLAIKASMGCKTDVFVSLACCIGKQEVDLCIRKGDGTIINEGSMNLPVSVIIDTLRLNKPIYASMCRWGLFGEFQQDKEWEKYKL